MLKLDSFGTPVSLNYADGSAEYRTGWGSCFNIVVMLLTLLYLLNNMVMMITRKGSTVSTTTEEAYFSHNDTFT